jgi:hypothetical protein
MIKYVTKCGKIEKKEITRETESSVFFDIDYFGKIQERCERKRTDYHCFFDTFEEAKNYLVLCATVRVTHAEQSLKYHQGELAKVQAINIEDVK